MKRCNFYLLTMLFSLMLSVSVSATETNTDTGDDIKVNPSHFNSEFQWEERVDEDGYVPVAFFENETPIIRILEEDYNATLTIYMNDIVYMVRKNPRENEPLPLNVECQILREDSRFGLVWGNNTYNMDPRDYYTTFLRPLLIDGYGWTEEECDKFYSFDYKLLRSPANWKVSWRTTTLDLGDPEYDPIDETNGYYDWAYVINECKDYFLSSKLFGDDGTGPDKDYLNEKLEEEKNNDENKLPMLHYKMSSKNVISFPNIIDKKISIDWDFTNLEPYASDPMSYALEILISANFYPNSEGLRHCWNATDSSINESCKRYLDTAASLLDKPFSFIYLKEGDALYTSTNHIFATDELQDGYYLYIRSYSKDGTKSSNYKVYKCTTGGVTGQMDLTYDTEGNEQPLEEEDVDEDSDYSNEYDEDSSSSADKTPTGDSYDGNGGYSFDTLYGNLNSMVNMLQGVPELWMNVMSWLPSWFPTFIVTMMGLLVVIGVLKYIF